MQERGSSCIWTQAQISREEVLTRDEAPATWMQNITPMTLHTVLCKTTLFTHTHLTKTPTIRYYRNSLKTYHKSEIYHHIFISCTKLLLLKDRSINKHITMYSTLLFLLCCRRSQTMITSSNRLVYGVIVGGKVITMCSVVKKGENDWY